MTNLDEVQSTRADRHPPRPTTLPEFPPRNVAKQSPRTEEPQSEEPRRSVHQTIPDEVDDLIEASAIAGEQIAEATARYRQDFPSTPEPENELKGEVTRAPQMSLLQVRQQAAGSGVDPALLTHELIRTVRGMERAIASQKTYISKLNLRRGGLQHIIGHADAKLGTLEKLTGGRIGGHRQLATQKRDAENELPELEATIAAAKEQLRQYNLQMNWAIRTHLLENSAEFGELALRVEQLRFVHDRIDAFKASIDTALAEIDSVLQMEAERQSKWDDRARERAARMAEREQEHDRLANLPEDDEEAGRSGGIDLQAGLDRIADSRLARWAGSGLGSMRNWMDAGNARHRVQEAYDSAQRLIEALENYLAVAEVRGLTAYEMGGEVDTLFEALDTGGFDYLFNDKPQSIEEARQLLADMKAKTEANEARIDGEYEGAKAEEDAFIRKVRLAVRG